MSNLGRKEGRKQGEKVREGKMEEGSERVTGRKARGLQMEEIGCKCQTFLSLLSGRRKQTGSPKGGNRLQVSDIFLSLKQQEETS